MAEAGADVMLFGHTHKLYHKALAVEAESGETVYQHAVNTGSVGKPKDGDPRADYVLLTVDAERPKSDPGYCRPEFVRVLYDVEEAARAVEASPLPDAFAEGLRRAR
jgi:diadenosine tetraphosphatase ApaH/serine/threonine PP2A family protein phosphatase